MVILGSTLLFAGCRPTSPIGSSFAVTDSMGIRIVESRRPLWPEGAGWRVAAEPDLVIGRSDEDERYFFDRIQAVGRFSDGRIAVLDGGSSSVRVYDAGGKHLGDLGGPGQGPGRLSRARYLHLLGDTILVFEAAPATLNWFDSRTGFVRDNRLARDLTRGTLYGIPVGMVGDALILSASPSARPQYRPGRHRESLSLWSLSISGDQSESIITVLGDEIQVGATGARNGLTFGARTYSTASGTWIYVGSSDQYSIDVYDGSGDLRRIIRREADERAVTDSDIERYAQQALAAVFRPAEQVAPFAQRIRALGTAAVMPKYRMLIVDSAENLWVEDWDDVGVEQGSFSVFSPEGTWLGRVELPAGLPWDRGVRGTLQIGRDYVLGVWIGGLGVEEVRLYRLNKGT